MPHTPPPSYPPYNRRVFTVIAGLLLALGVFGLAFVPLRGSQDEWWHLKTGQWIWQHGGLPENDIFTYTGEDMRWYNHEWLSQVLFYGSYRAAEVLGFAGISGLILLKSVIVALAFGLVAGLARQRHLTWPAACAIAMVAADISRRTIFPRPPIFSYVLLAVALLLLYAWKSGRLRFRWVWLLVPVTILWGNLHGMVLLSFIVAGAFAGGEFLENLRRWWIAGRQRATLLSATFTRPFFYLSLLTVALVFAAMAQPSGYHLFFLGRNFTADPLLQSIIQEMLPTPRPFLTIDPLMPWWHYDNLVMRPPGFWTFWVALAIIVVLFIRNRLRLPYGADYLLLAFFTYQALAHWRLLPLFAIVMAGPLASLLKQRIDHLPPRLRAAETPVFTAVLVGLVGWFNFTVNENDTFFQRNLQMVRGQTTNNFDYPAPLMDYIIEADLPPRMFGDSNYCGYAIWRLSPEHYKLFTDNRFDLFGSEFIRFERWVHAAAQPGDVDRVTGETVTESWQEILDNYGVNFLVFRPIDRPELHRALTRSSAWRMVYYYITPGSLQREWPYNGNHVWVRNNQDTEAIARRSEEIFMRQSPNQMLPSQLEKFIKQQPPAPATDPGLSPGKSDWRVP